MVFRASILFILVFQMSAFGSNDCKLLKKKILVEWKVEGGKITSNDTLIKKFATDYKPWFLGRDSLWLVKTLPGIHCLCGRTFMPEKDSVTLFTMVYDVAIPIQRGDWGTLEGYYVIFGF